MSRAAWPFAGLSALAAVLIGIFDSSEWPTSLIDAAGVVAWLLLPVTFAVVAAVIISRRPDNVIGWLLAIPVVGIQAGVLAELLLADIEAAPDQVSASLIVALMGDNYSWMLLIFPVFHLLLVFPTGRSLSPRWRWLVGLEIAMALFLLMGSLFSERIGPIDGPWTIENPIGFIPEAFFGPTFQVLWAAGLLVLTVGGGVSTVVRYRRSGRAERQQLKWLLFAFVVFAVSYSILSLIHEAISETVFALLLALSIMFIPISTAIAVLRYRLFEIDRLVSRTVTYAVVIGVLGLVYAGLVVGLRGLLPVEGDLPVAVSTLVVALAFLPLVRRVQRVVDRRFFRSRYDAGLVVARVAEELRRSLDLEEVKVRAESVVAEVFSPETVAIWIADETGTNP